MCEDHQIFLKLNHENSIFKKKKIYPYSLDNYCYLSERVLYSTE